MAWKGESRRHAMAARKARKERVRLTFTKHRGYPMRKRVLYHDMFGYYYIMQGEKKYLKNM